jgi:hypothetical protein
MQLSFGLMLVRAYVCVLQDTLLLKMIVDLACVDTGVASLAFAHAIEAEEAEMLLQQEAAVGAVGRTRRSSPRGKAVSSPRQSPRANASKRRRMSRTEK